MPVVEPQWCNVKTRVRPAELEELERIAAEQDRSLSSVLRLAIRQYLAVQDARKAA
jgi:predicted transcriptional regulator